MLEAAEKLTRADEAQKLARVLDAQIQYELHIESEIVKAQRAINQNRPCDPIMLKVFKRNLADSSLNEAKEPGV